MLSETIIGKAIDFVLNLVINFLVHVVKLYSPIKIFPNRILAQEDARWSDILTIEIENRLNNDLYDVTIIGISKTIFEIKILSDSSPKGKTVQFMDINTNHLVVYGQDRNTKNYWWIFRIHKLASRGKLLLNVKIENRNDIFFSLSRYSRKEIPVRERVDGTVSIPFQIGKIPKIK